MGEGLVQGMRLGAITALSVRSSSDEPWRTLSTPVDISFETAMIEVEGDGVTREIATFPNQLTFQLAISPVARRGAAYRNLRTLFSGLPSRSRARRRAHRKGLKRKGRR